MNHFKGWSDERFMAWLAGFWEGEGHVCVTRNTGSNNIKCKAFSMGITQKNRDILESIQERFGYGGIYRGHDGIHNFIFHSRGKIIIWLSQMLPYLTFRKAAVKKMLDLIIQYENDPTIDRSRFIKWTPEEDKILIDNWGGSFKKIKKDIPRHRISSLYNRSRKLRVIHQLPYRKMGRRAKNGQFV
jgi:hypothetical protein